MIGGGLVRDAILGGRPSDIDVWLPSNVTVPDVEVFKAYLQMMYRDALVETMFTGPGAHGANLFGTPEGIANYGDVNNHWVLEMSLNPFTPTINIMRSMTRWDGSAQNFFNGLMRAFDIDYCMFFIGYMPGQNTVNTVIMPQHMADNLYNRIDRNTIGRFRLNSLYWNRYRLEQTSQARIEARIQKMMDKYHFWALRGIADTPARIMERIQSIETDQIIATPVQLSRVMRRANNPYTNPFPMPTRGNSQQLVLPDEQAQAILNRRA